MTPEVRAIADRFIYEQATLKHIAALIPEGGLDRAVPGYEWTVRQLLGHLARSLHAYQEVIERWLAGGALPEGWDPEKDNWETAVWFAEADLAKILALFGTGLNGLVAALAAIPEDKLQDESGLFQPLEGLRIFGAHCISHAIALVEAVPEVRMDPLVLNWLFDAKFEDDASTGWQAQLLEEARVYIANHPEEEDEE